MPQETVQAKYSFTVKEKTDIAGKLAQRQIELVEAEEEKKTVVASFADKVKRIKLDISKLSRGYRDGWEMRDFECNVFKDYKKREKIYKDVRTGAVVDRKPFMPGDEQREIE